MNAPLLFMGIASFSLGLLLTLFPRFIGLNLAKFQKTNLEKLTKDPSFRGQVARDLREKMRTKFSQFSPNLDDQVKTARTIRQIGIVFMIQALLFFVLAVMLRNEPWH